MTIREKVVAVLEPKCRGFGSRPLAMEIAGEFADAALAALGLNEGGPNVVVPKEVTPAMRWAVWFDQYKFNGGTDEEARILTEQRMADPKQEAEDHSSYRAMLAANEHRKEPA